MLCGRPEKEVIYAEDGFGAKATAGYAWDGWNLPVYHCRAGDDVLRIELSVPREAQGKVRIYVIDPDHFEGGRKQTVSVEAQSLGVIEEFVEGRWLERVVKSSDSPDGKVVIEAHNTREGSNAVISIVEWIGQ